MSPSGKRSMKLVYCVCLVAVLMIFSEGEAWITASLISETAMTTAAPAREESADTMSPAFETNTTPRPTPRPTTEGPLPAVNLKGKMFTMSDNSGVKFYPPHYQSAPAEGGKRPWHTITSPGPATPPAMKGLSVCLRFLSDSSPKLFTLYPGNIRPLSFSLNSPWYSLYIDSPYYTRSVSLKTVASLWSSVPIQPWTSVCVILDSLKNVVQVFEGGAMSVKKKLPSEMKLFWEPLLSMPGFDGQVTDMEVWDYPLQYKEVLGYMQNYGPSGTVLTWSNIVYQGDVLVEDTYVQQMRQPIRSSEGGERPIKHQHGRNRQVENRKKLSGKRQRKTDMF